MTHTPFPRTPSSATGGAQARIARGQPNSAELDLRRRIRADLLRAQRFYDLNRGDLTLLDAMLSVLRDGGRMVFASNAVLSLRADGMSERSISRHAGRLRKLGFLRREDSPNCKRYVIRDGKRVVAAYGFDLTPFFERAPEFARKAQEADDQDADITVTRNRVSALRARLEELEGDPALIERLRRSRRWALSPTLLSELVELERQAIAALETLGAPCPEPDPAPVGPVRTEEMATNDSHSGRQYQSRNDRVFLGKPPEAAQAADLDKGKNAERLVGEAGTRVTASVRNRTKYAPASKKDAMGPLPCPDDPTLPQESVKNFAQRVLAELQQKLTSGTRQSQRNFRAPEQTRRPAEDLTAVKPIGSEGGDVISADVIHGSPGGISGRSLDGSPANGCRKSASFDPSGIDGPCREAADDLPDFELILATCPEAMSFVPECPRNWSQLFEAAWSIGKFMNIAEKLMAEACAQLGRAGLSVTLLALCERHAEIRNPSGYLQKLLSRRGFRPMDLLRPVPFGARPA